jgi:FKBP-type peptidyl-prolyl cis-trans isomerase 2
MREYILLMAAALLLFGCVDDSRPLVNDTGPKTPIISPSGGTNQTVTPQNQTGGIPQDYSVDYGDTIWVDYVLWVDGEVFDTNNATVANESGQYTPFKDYKPFGFQVQRGKGVIDGFVYGVIGLRINESVIFTVSPERGYGPYDFNNVLIVPRYYNRSLFEVVPRSYLEDIEINITDGASYKTDSGLVFINSSNEENVTLFYVLTPGSDFVYNGIPQVVANVTNLTATIEYDLRMNKSYTLPHPATAMPTPFTVTAKTDQNITLDGNHPLANESLQFRVTLLEAIPYAD